MPPPVTAPDVYRRRGARRRLVAGRRVPAPGGLDSVSEHNGSMLELTGVYKTFRRRGRSVTALAGVDLRVERGEFVCLLGPSGCGKSTALNLAAGILEADAGSVTVEGQPVTGPSAERAMLFQSPLLFPWLTIRQNVLF